MEELYILQWRKARGLTQSVLAKMAAMNRITLLQIEHGRVLRPRRSSLEGLASALKCRVEQLYGPPGVDIKPFTPRLE